MLKELWGYVKNIVYQVEINDLQHLKASIRDTVATVTPNILQATWNEVECCLDICHATKGANIENIEKTLIVSLCNGVTHKYIS
jgi:hypothetical protein